ncbi:lysoplasmalogenase [Streptomyces sp. BI20]|uniref:lysoplasmalogenase n=1 Tax=Streptomyces sp. BI20 TaxID=3403460 RepID=UPI003C71ED89
MSPRPRPRPLVPPRSARRERVARAALIAFALAAAADLGSLLLGWSPGHPLFKPLLMPLLAAHAAALGAPRLLLAALAFGWGGDVALLFDADPAFLLGMGSFALGHVCWLLLFRGRRTDRRLALGYAPALVGTLVLLWPDLPPELRVPVAGYSLLLTAMAWRSAALGRAAGIGGALFLLSDTLIATGVAQWPQAPRPDFWIMATYLAAQLLLTRGVLAGEQAYGGEAVTAARATTARPAV